MAQPPGGSPGFADPARDPAGRAPRLVGEDEERSHPQGAHLRAR